MDDGAPSGSLFDPAWMPFLTPVSRLHAVIPFEREWDRLLRDALGPEQLGDLDDGSSSIWGPLGAAKDLLSKPLAAVLGRIVKRLRAGVTPTAEQIALYRGAALYGLWDRFGAQLQQIVEDDGVAVPFYDDFVEAHRTLLRHPGLVAPEPAHLLAIFYQARRACFFIGSKIAGRSNVARRSRATIWRAIFGGDICTYARDLYRAMDELTVLITGETGTGKDLAAECIGWSRYIPFDPGARRFAARYAEDFHVRNLCEVPGELLPSALFGHKKGSFTGALADAPGCLGLAQANGTLFLDEIGEIPLPVQAKLLRPFQNREYVPLGETRPRPIHGRLVFATHRDLEAMCERGEFREDLFERINVIRVHMPSLRELRADGGLLEYVGRFVAAKIDDPELLVEHTMAVMRAIQDTRADYDWPRNLRELKHYTERCLLDGVQHAEPLTGPAPASVAAPPPESVCLPSSGILGPRAKVGDVDHEELIRAYVTQILAHTGMNKAETARLTGFDRRTLARWIDPVRLSRLRRESK